MTISATRETAAPHRPAVQPIHATLLALGAIVLWSMLATLGTHLRHVPPFLLTGLSLCIGSLIALPLSGFQLSRWRVPLPTLALGIYGLFGYHFLLFLALRHAPALQANLINYLWPLLMVLLAPVILPGLTLRPLHVVAGLLGFSGAVVVILGGAVNGSSTLVWSWGYLAALLAAIIWASYSLLTRRVAVFPSSAIGGFALLSGVLALLCHVMLESSVTLSRHDWFLIAVMGLGPLGAAFFLWDKALKTGDARQIGILSYLTPLLSTALLLWVSDQGVTWPVVLATLLIVSGAWMGSRAK